MTWILDPAFQYNPAYMRRVGHERKYPKLSPEEKSAVLDDLKEHLRITDRQRSLRELGQEMLESIKKRPTVH